MNLITISSPLSLFFSYSIAGKYQNEEAKLSCDSCLVNTYTDKPGKTSCSSCDTGKISATGRAVCQPCGAGTYGDDCQPCQLGYARNSTDHDATQCRQCQLGETTTIIGAATCDKCDLGKYGSKNGDCTDCPPGSYQDGKGETECRKCEVDTYLIETGKSSKADCRKCDSKKSTGEKEGNINQFACLCRKEIYYQDDDGECAACPIGADCSLHDGMTLAELSALPGYWRADVASKNFEQCSVVYKGANANEIASQRCCPPKMKNCSAINQKNRTLPWNADTQCLEGYQGILCGGCRKDYVRTGDDCLPCEGGWNVLAAAGSLLLSCLIISVMSFVIIKKVKTLEKHKENDLMESISTQFAVLTSWLQILSVLTKTFDGVPWGESFTSYSKGSGVVVNLDFSFFLRTSCSMALPFLEQFGLLALYPIFITVAIKLGQCLAMKRVKEQDRRTAQGAMGDKITLLFIMLLFPSIANKSFTVFRCRDVLGVDYQVMDEDFSVKCWEGHHQTYVAFACISIAICKSCFITLLFFIILN